MPDQARGGRPQRDHPHGDQPERDQPQRDRADRILDAAGELLLTLGYRKVTIDDIAGRARIGKGTVYLHWRTKGQLFQALIGRESVQLTDEVIGVLAGDAAAVRPHQLLRRCSSPPRGAR